MINKKVDLNQKTGLVNLDLWNNTRTTIRFVSERQLGVQYQKNRNTKVKKKPITNNSVL